MAFKIIQLTDLHLVKPGKTLFGIDPVERVDCALRDIEKNHADTNLLVITGDLTHGADEEAYGWLHSRLRRIEIPRRILIGNHDDRQIFKKYFPETPIDSHGFIQYIEPTVVGTMVYLDTNEPGTHKGCFCELRQKWLSEVLNNTLGPVFLFMHHPPFPIGIDPMDRIMLEQREAFADIVRPHTFRIKHLFLGHIHRPLAGSWQSIPVSALPSQNHQVMFDLHAYGNEIDFTLEPPAYGVAIISPEQVIFHMHNYMYADGHHLDGIYNSTSSVKAKIENDVDVADV